MSESTPILKTSNGATVRPYNSEVDESIAEMANDKRIWMNMSHRFPHPYTLESARTWTKITQDRNKWIPTVPNNKHDNETEEMLQTRRNASRLPFCYAIWIDGRAVGTIGLEYEDHPDFPHIVELGYWLGVPYHGKGHMTQIVKAFVQWTFDTFPWILRIDSCTLGWNAASQHVLQKAGFSHEGTERLKYSKDGKLVDKVLFGLLRPDPTPNGATF